MKQKYFFGSVIGVVLALFVFVVANGTVRADTKNIQVVSSVDFYGEAAEKVLGQYGTVKSVITNPNVDPHDYEPSAKVATEVSKADLVVYNGIGYDSWMTKLAKNANVKSVRVGEDILGKKNGDNPHLWYQSQTMPKLANYLADKFSKIDPKHKAAFKANAKKYIASLEPIQTKIKELKKNSDNKLVDVSEPVFDYALEELGYSENNTHFSKSVEDGTDPSPKDIKAMQDDIKNKKISFFVQNTQATDKTVGQLVKLAKKHNVPVLNVTETMPKGKNYKQWMLSQYKQLEKIQKSEQ
ncbi:metal ABC transporter solute-binding protein [Leuconostoc suionicum]|uniref:Manganese ABC transporter substrate-binding lipoprotein n=1 Tax=Leuconostoc suionicum TaxID=1511761 RepID=A0A2N9K8V6_9LACO|nr:MULTISPECIES: metal ABC transporter solute-binding protein [Leuconostoc]API71863.1 metal ABC transporter substrate-binding protein [Leuconostoc suionicum]MBE4726954.1 zinc ABC transporter substrate-binding protein [Leuconostoc suionicum]MCT4376505.1 metal ABC transporter substrate-binding protein [Leuconostoc suionicum]MCT4402667.1 metal ABC transporter substrate-binding protein [Leuconostoc suionicum]MDC2815613.1 metal ABC transporter solute-binding protein [Leuconostoc suionicum]